MRLRRTRRDRRAETWDPLLAFKRPQFICASGTGYPIHMPPNYHEVEELVEARRWLERRREDEWTTWSWDDSPTALSHAA